MKALARAIAAMAVLLPLVSARAQVSVGYSAVISAASSQARDQVLNLRSRNSFGIAGSNVEPIDGGKIYDSRTIWRIRDTSKPSSLSLRREDSVFDAQEDQTDTQQIQVARREQVTVSILAPLTGVLEPQAVSPFAPVLPVLTNPLSTSVFP